MGKSYRVACIGSYQNSMTNWYHRGRKMEAMIMKNKEVDPNKKSPSELFKGLSVREEFGLYRFPEEESEDREEREEHGTLQTKRVNRQKKPTKHIAQGLYW